MLNSEDLARERTQLDTEWARLRAEQAEFEAERQSSGVEYKLFVGNLDDETTQDELKAMFEAIGSIKEVVLLKGRDGRSKRSGFVKFFTKKSADQAISEISGKVHDKSSPKAVVVRYASGGSQMGMVGMQQSNVPQSGAGANGEFKLFCGNLDDRTTEDELKALFEQFGTIVEVVLLKNREGVSKRSGFVKFSGKKDGDDAIAGLHNNYTDKDSTKTMVVRWANSRPPASRFGMQQMQQAFTQANRFGMQQGGMGMQSQNPYAQQSMGMGMGGYGASTAAYPQQSQQQGYGASQQMGGYGAALQAANAYSAAAAPMGGSGNGRGPPGGNLYVNNLSRYATEDDVAAMFADFGRVVSATTFPNGYGFVSFDNPQSAQAAIAALNGLPTGEPGRTLEVSLKKEKGAPASKRFTPY